MTEEVIRLIGLDCFTPIDPKIKHCRKNTTMAPLKETSWPNRVAHGMEKAPLYVKQYQTKTSWVKALTYKKNVGKSKAELLSPQLLSKQGTLRFKDRAHMPRVLKYHILINSENFYQN